nr:nucleotidyltransferase domain-containing protein [Saccharolobus shibatae]
MRRNWRRVAERVKEIGMKYGKVNKVIVFGSVIEDKITGSSDLDIVVFYDEKIGDNDKIKRTLEILNELQEDIIYVDLKVLRKDEENWFLKFVEKYAEI